MKLPVFGTIRNGAILATRIGHRHLGALAGFAVFYAVIWYGVDAADAQSGAPPSLLPAIQSIFHLVASLIIAILVNREILVGPTSFRSFFSRPGFGRLGRYFVNSMAVGGVLVGPALLMVIVSLVTWQRFADNRFPFYLSVIAVFFVSALISVRLVLMLPACAINEPLTWRQVWALGRGNTLRLLGRGFPGRRAPVRRFGA